MPNKNLSVDVLITDGGTQSRVSISEETVADYTEVIESNGSAWPFPPIVVYHDGNQYFVADGFHRVLAARRAKRGNIPCEVRKGTAQDALRFGMTANDTHGLRMSQADKRNCVELLLDGDEKLTRQEIADIAGVTKRTVQRIVCEHREGGVTLSPPSGQSGANGDFDSFDEDADTIRGGMGRERTAERIRTARMLMWSCLHRRQRTARTKRWRNLWERAGRNCSGSRSPRP